MPQQPAHEATTGETAGAGAGAQYHNIFALVRELGIPWPFTDWTTSGFWSPEGLTTEAPIFSRRPQLPTMLGQFVHTLPLFRYLAPSCGRSLHVLLHQRSTRCRCLGACLPLVGAPCMSSTSAP